MTLGLRSWATELLSKKGSTFKDKNFLIGRIFFKNCLPFMTKSIGKVVSPGSVSIHLKRTKQTLVHFISTALTATGRLFKINDVVLLKFQPLISEICQYFYWGNVKSFSHFFSKNISVVGYKVIKHSTS